jgi:hypothetical protein
MTFSASAPIFIILSDHLWPGIKSSISLATPVLSTPLSTSLKNK